MPVSAFEVGSLVRCTIAGHERSFNRRVTLIPVPTSLSLLTVLSSDCCVVARGGEVHSRAEHAERAENDYLQGSTIVWLQQ